MLSSLIPDHYYRNIFNIDLEQLQRNNIKGIICDIDNTIVPYKKRSLKEKVVNWFDTIQDEGFKVCLVSNGMDSRVNFFSKELDIPAIGQAIKPRKKAYQHAIEILKLDKPQIVVIGDQIFTDILGGNRLELETILVNPMDKNEFFITRLVRKFEGLVFKRKL